MAYHTNITVKGDKGNYEGSLDGSGNPIGYGTMWYDNGNVYQGDWSSGFWHGDGKLSTANYEYNGNFRRGSLTGEGRKQYKSNGVYSGWFVNGKREGTGDMDWPNGQSFQGQWVNDGIKGNGRMSWPNGDWWETDWDGPTPQVRAGKSQNGKGRARWHDPQGTGNIYEGETRGYWRHGFGVLTTPDRIYEGYFKNGHKNGRFKITNRATGKVYHETF